MVSALTSSRVVTSKCIMGFEATDCHRWESSGFYSWRRVFSSVNYNNVYCRWITTQYLRQIKDNSKLNNGRFKKWLKILAGKDLQTKLRKSEKVDFKFSASNGTDVYKTGTGTSGRDIGTRVWGLGTWGRETKDLRISSMGREDVKNRDAGTLGARGFSCAVSGFGQALKSDPRITGTAVIFHLAGRQDRQS